MRRATLAAAMLLVAGTAKAACPPASPIATHVFGGGLCLAADTFGEAGDTLVAVVHGDISDGGLATYHVDFARALARPGVVAVALTRPGYTNGRGQRSEGDNHGRSDSYTPAAVAAIGGAIAHLKRHYRARRVVYVGHSGGAAIGGALIGRRPGLVDVAILVSCPCDLARWLGARGGELWHRSLSPELLRPKVPKSTEVVAITGALDDNTTPDLARDYAAKLVRRGVPARFVEVAGAGHGFSGLRAATATVVDAAVRAESPIP